MVTMLIPIEGIPELRPGDDLAEMLAVALEDARVGVKAGDVLVVCQKVVSKAEGRVAVLAEVEVSTKARRFAVDYGKDAALVELALRESTEVLRMTEGHLITVTGPGWVCANSGVDRSNQSADGEATLLPVDADKSAALLRGRLEKRFGVALAVVVTDTFGRAWRLGQVDFAIGSSGIEVLRDYGGREDSSGRALEHTVVAVVDQLAAASGLVAGKNEGIPAVLVRGYSYACSEEPASCLVRAAADDLFR